MAASADGTMKILKLLLLLTIAFNALPLHAQSDTAEILTPEQVLQLVFDHYPSISVAAIEIERARQSIKTADSQLGWNLNAQLGIERGVGMLGSATDIVSAGAGASRLLESGSTITVEGGLRREDADNLLAPTIPNPATSSSVEVSLRQPLAKNTTQTDYAESRLLAEQEVELARAEQGRTYDQLAGKVLDIYFSAASQLARLENIEQTMQRAKRLHEYITRKTSLGMSEQKDILQVNAQIDALKAEKQTLLISWAQQKVALNRLMARPWNAEFTPVYKAEKMNADFNPIYAEVKNHNPELKLLESQLASVDSKIRTRREQREDQLDLVWFAGGNNYSGDTATGSASESVLTGGLKLEYQQKFDKSGVDAELYQSQLERNEILHQRKLLLEDINYSLAGLLAEIKANQQAVNAYVESVSSETAKVDEAMNRYRSGRINTDVLINFEDQLSLAKFSLELQRISYVKRQYLLEIMQGSLWRDIKIPDFQRYLDEPSTGDY